MPLVLADRVRDTTTTTGTGTVTLSGTAPTGYQSFAVIGNGNTTYYTINAGSQWEVGIGTYSSTGPTLARNTVLESSNSNALVDFAAGTKDVFVTYPADKSVNYDESNNVGIGTTTSSAKLNVNSSSGAAAILLTNSFTSNPFLQFANGSFIQGIGSGGSEALRFRAGGTTGFLVLDTNSSERMRITAAGDVGIGTSAPAGRVAVASATGNTGFNTGTSSSPERGNLWYDTDGTGWKFNIGKLQSGTFTAQMTFQDNGNVGIGTTSPSTPLTVAGAVTVNNGVLDLTSGFGLRWGSGASAIVGSSGNADMVFTVGSAERFRVNGASGNVGIGTNSPAQRLDVLSSGDTPAVFRSAGANTYFQFVNSVASAGYIGYSGSALTFWTGSERVRITAAGDVGVGTSAPVNKLQSAYNVPVSVPATGTVGGHGFAVGEGGFGIAAGALNNGNGYLQVTHWDGTSANYNLLLQPNGGNVGIGTSTPGAKLEVQGTDGVSSIVVRDSATTNIFDVVPIASNGALVRVFDNTGVSRVQFTAYATSYFNAGNVGIGTTSPTRRLSVAGTANAYMDFSASSFRRYTIGSESVGFALFDDTASAYRMVVDGSGNVGIGTTSPATRLTVSDGAITAGASGDVLIGRNSSAFPNPGAGYFRLRTNNTDGSNGGVSIDTLAANTLTERMRIDSSGRVGVATTAPDTTFEVALSTSGFPGLRASRSGAPSQYIQMDIGQGASARLFATGSNKAMFITNNNSNAGLGTATDSTFIQVPGPSANTPITAMYLESSTANVGIGTTTPAGRLHAVNSYTNSSDATIIAGGNIPGINLRTASSGRFSILTNFGAANTTTVAASTGTNNPSEVMRIDHASGAFIIGTGAPNAAAQLQVDSTTRGFLPPRMTTAQRDAITTPPDGLMLYNTTTNKLQVRAAGAWVDLH